MRSAILLAILVLAPLTDAIAQEHPLQPGQRVRVEERRLPRAVYTLIRVEHDALVVLRGGYDDSLDIPFARIERLQVSRGRDPTGARMLRGAKYGMLVLGSLGGVLGAVTCSGEPEYVCLESPVASAALFAGVFGAVGGIFGAAFGAASSGDRWEEVPLDRLRVSVTPQRDGRFALGVSVRF